MRESSSEEDSKQWMGAQSQDAKFETFEEENANFDILNGLTEWILLDLSIISRLIGNNSRFNKEAVVTSSIFIKI